MRQFPASPITALIDEKPRYNLGESVAPDLTVADLLGSAGLADLADVKLGYGTSAGSSELRALVAARHGIADSQVLITTGAAAALFLVAPAGRRRRDRDRAALLPAGARRSAGASAPGW